MNANASGATTPGDRVCMQCAAPFTARRPWARFCSAKCRNLHHAGDDALRGKVSKVSVMRRGKVSVVVHFDLEDRERAAALTPGDVLEVLR